MECRRREERVPVDVDVAYEDPGRQVFLPAVNLSAGGVFLEAQDLPALGEQVNLVLSLPPEGVFLRVSGQVVRHGAASEQPGFAVAFRDLDERCRSQLREFVAAPTPDPEPTDPHAEA